MKSTYKSDNPQFSDTLKELETTDPAHADVFNEINRELFENTVYLKEKISDLQFSISNGILCVTYDDGTEEGVD